MADIASFVISRVSRHPPGTAALIAQFEPNLAQLVRAIARGMDATSGPAVAIALVGDDEAHRALALSILEPVVIPIFKDEVDRPFAPFTRRRATVEGLDTLIAFAKTITTFERRGGPVTNANRYLEQIVLETPQQADRLIELAGGGADAQAARHILERIGLATPQFLKRLVAATDQGDELAPFALLAVAKSLHAAPIVGQYLSDNGTIAEIWRRLKARPDLKRRIYAESPYQAADYLKLALRLDPDDMDRAYMAHCACSLARKSDVIPSLGAWGATFFVSNRPEIDQAIHNAGIQAAEDPRTLSSLISYCAWDARSRKTFKHWEGLGFRSMAWPMLASCVDHCPVTLQARLHGAAVFDDLPSLARIASSWVTRRSAFLLMPLEWHGRPARVSFDVIEAALSASGDIWQVQETALAMVGSIRSLDTSALDILYEKAGSGGVRALMAFRMINAILNNDRTPLALREHAQTLVERALNSDLAGLVIEHGIATATAPPRMRLRDVLLQQIFADA